MPVRRLAFMPRKPLDGVTRNMLCSGAAAPMGGGSCLLLGERRKVRRGPGCPFKGSPGRARRRETPLAEGLKYRKERKGGHYDTPPCVHCSDPRPLP